MNTATVTRLATLIGGSVLVLALSQGPALASHTWFRFGGGVSFLNMSDFNDGVTLMNDLVRDEYRLGFLDQNPDIPAGELEAAVNTATSDKLLNELTGGATFSLALARSFGEALSVGLEYERMFVTSDRVFAPDVNMYYTAPADLYKAFVELNLKPSARWTFGVNGAAGYAQAGGYLKMPDNVTRTVMREAYLSGGGPLFEAAGVAAYDLGEGVALTALLGYRITSLDESDQTWFKQSSRVPVDLRAIPLQDIPLKLDYGGVFLRLGFTVRLR